MHCSASSPRGRDSLETFYKNNNLQSVAQCATLFCMLFIRKLIWDERNIKHISRHNVISDEVEAVCHNNPLILQGQKKGRLVVISETLEKRLLGVVLEAKGKGVYYPVTAYETDEHDTTLYYRLRGGDNNENNKK